MSPARTATHIHQGDTGKAGLPRPRVSNPEDAADDTLTSERRRHGPFTTGIRADRADTGTGFTLDQVGAKPAAFSPTSAP